MRLPRPAALIVTLLGLALLLATLFPAFVLDNVVMPIALVFWVCWRVLQSVNQAACWGLLIFSAAVFVLARSLRPSERAPGSEHVSVPDSSAVLERIDYWRMSIRVNRADADRWGILRQSLGKMLVTLYAARQPEAAHFEIHDALRLRRDPLPDSVHTFLFPPDPPRGRLARLRQAVREAPGKWYRHWTGRDVAEYYRSIDTVVDFMESSLEDRRGDRYPGDYHH